MSADLRNGWFVEDPAEGQLVEGGVNRYNNCVPTARLICAGVYLRMQGLPGDPFEPQDVTNAEYGRYYQGGEDSTKVTEFIRAHPAEYPDMPEIRDVSANLDQLRAWLDSGFMIEGYFHCDRDANINSAGPYAHDSLIVAYDAGGFHVWNPEKADHSEYYTNDDFSGRWLWQATVWMRSTWRSAPVITPPAPARPKEVLDMGPVAICTHPDGTRRDIVGVGTDNAVYHGYAPDGDLDHMAAFAGTDLHYQSLGGKAAAVACYWLDAATFVVLALGPDGDLNKREFSNNAWSGWVHTAAEGVFA